MTRVDLDSSVLERVRAATGERSSRAVVDLALRRQIAAKQKGAMIDGIAALQGLPTGLGADCTHSDYHGDMSKVMQIRDVPEDVHAALVDAAQAQGLSLTRYVLRELEQVARRAQVVRDNAAVIRRTQQATGGRADREAILAALDDGRGN